MLKSILVFGLGVVVGSATTYFIIKKHYSDIAQEEIDSVKSVYKKKCENLDSVIKIRMDKEKSDLSDKLYKRFQDAQNEYLGEEEEIEEDIEEDPDYDENVERIFPDEERTEPYIISPDQFVNENRYYDKITLYYYEDTGQLLTDEEDLTEIDVSIGADSLEHFGEYEKDVVYVRNDRLSIDYEVIHELNQPDILGKEED